MNTQSIFETMGGTYRQEGDHRLPDLAPPAENKQPLGPWALRRLRYLKHYRRVTYTNLLTSGALHSHLADVETRAQTLFSQLVKEYAEREGVTEQLKAKNQMVWVGRMNEIRARAREVVGEVAIYE